MRKSLVILMVLSGAALTAQQPANPRQQPGATITMFAPEQHDLYDGHYVMSANRIYMVGGLNDPAGLGSHGQRRQDRQAGRRHGGDRRQRAHQHRQVRSAAEDSRGRSRGGDRSRSTSSIPVRTAGIVGFLHEHGTDSGCGDNNWPKTFVYLAGWGFGHATLNGKPALRQLRDALHDHAGNPRSEDAERELSDGEQEAAGGRGEPGDSADRLLHPEPAAEPAATSRTARCSCTSSGWRSPGSRVFDERAVGPASACEQLVS